MSDPFFYNLQLLLTMDGVNSSSSFPSENPYSGHRMTANAGAQLSSSQSKFRTTSLYLNGAGAHLGFGATGGSVSDQGTEMFAPGGDWSVDCWVRPDDFAIPRYIFGARHQGSNTEFAGLHFNTVGRLNLSIFGTVRCSGTTACATGTWYHVAISRCNDEIRMFLNGVQEGATYAYSLTNLTSNGINIGGSTDASGSTGKFKGYISEFRLYRGVALYAANFTPPGALDTDVLPYFGVAPPVATKVVAGTFVENVTPIFLNPAIHVLDRVWGGTGVISGTVKVEADPVDTPVMRRVRLLSERDGLLVRDMWSNPTTGAYAFANIDPTIKYTVLTYDYSHNFRAVVADNITPDTMP